MTDLVAELRGRASVQRIGADRSERGGYPRDAAHAEGMAEAYDRAAVILEADPLYQSRATFEKIARILVASGERAVAAGWPAPDVLADLQAFVATLPKEAPA